MFAAGRGDATRRALGQNPRDVVCDGNSRNHRRIELAGVMQPGESEPKRPVAELDATSIDLAAVRRFVAETLGRWGLADLDLDAKLLATEIVTNAREHGAPPVLLRLSLSEGRLRVSVTDASRKRPVAPETASPLDKGQGLLISHRMAVAAGVDGHRRGKTVWFELRAE
jgi:anti-sigma regulatory factor (Ser/Thr protein kinase)